MSHPHQDWWRNAVVYQIYPKSFQDSGAKGTGDLRGILQRLNYLKTLGVDAIWITPFYESPQVDNGYDIADYYTVDPSYGCMDDFDTLVAGCRQYGIKIILDMVFNHTSTQHAWFQAALADRNSPYRDFYIWQDPIDGKEPNNWQSKFGGSAWQYDDSSQQYYLHLFSAKQADLNWENPAVRAELKKILHFWADKGVDGFRLDVVNLISKQQQFPNDPIGDGRRFYTDGPRVHEYLQELARDVFIPRGCMTVGEMSSTTLEHCQQYSQQSGSELSMVFNFHHLKVDYPQGEKWQLAPANTIELKGLFQYWQQGLYQRGWSALFWCNHDQPRIVSRFGHEGEYREKSAKMLAAVLHMMQGTPYIYQGEEIGMTNPHFQSLGQYRDVESLNIATILQQQGKSTDQILAILAQRSRDNGRTPMQWDASNQSGFTQGMSWIPLADNAQSIYVDESMKRHDSVFHFYRKLIQLRKSYPIITEGDYLDRLPLDPNLWIYQREYEHQQLFVIANLSDQFIKLPDKVLPTDKLICLLHNQTHEPDISADQLAPYDVSIWLTP